MNRDQQHYYQQTKRISLLGAVANALLGLFKVVIGITGHSQALIADGIHSFSDIGTDILVIIAAKMGSHGPDQDHPYGHARIETFATMILAVILVIVGIVIASRSILEVAHLHHLFKSGKLVIVMATVSIIANEFLYRITRHVGERIQSRLLHSNAWHHRIDALSSLVVLIGVIGTQLSFLWLDNVAAIIVALFIVKAGIDLAWPNIKELVDTGLSEADTKKIIDYICHVPGVQSVHQLRTRSLGNAVFADVHVQVSHEISVSEGHYIADQVYDTLVNGNFSISDALIHIDAEDDEHGHYALALPDRAQIEQDIEQYCRQLPGYAAIEKIQIHYLAALKQVSIELFLPLSVLEQQGTAAVAVQQQYQNAMKSGSYLAKIRLHFSVNEQ